MRKRVMEQAFKELREATEEKPAMGQPKRLCANVPPDLYLRLRRVVDLSKVRGEKVTSEQLIIEGLRRILDEYERRLGGS